MIEDTPANKAGSKGDAQDRLAALRQGYAEGLPAKVKQVENAWAALRANWTPHSLDSLYRQAHAMSGSGATFGFPELSHAAHDLEVFLQSLLAISSEPTKAQL